jgi:hypothetical protein
MTGATNLFQDKILALIFTNAAAANIGDAAGLPPSIGENNYHISLHLLDALTDASTSQQDNEAGYTGYGRVAVPRNVSDWTVLTGTVDNDNLLQFGNATAATPETITDVGLGFANTGVGELQLWSQVLADLIVNIGVNPEFAPGALAISLD